MNHTVEVSNLVGQAAAMAGWRRWAVESLRLNKSRAFADSLPQNILTRKNRQPQDSRLG